MQAVALVSPLMQRVQIKGREYYTSHANHKWYLENSENITGKIKYKLHRNYLRRLKSIESYPLFVEHGHFIVLTRENLCSISEHFKEIKTLESLLTANNFHPVYLIDAAFQTELAHHLDDELSKETAYRHSKTWAIQQEIAEGQTVFNNDQLKVISQNVGIGISLVVPSLIEQALVPVHEQLNKKADKEDVDILNRAVDENTSDAQRALDTIEREACIRRAHEAEYNGRFDHLEDRLQQQVPKHRTKTEWKFWFDRKNRLGYKGLIPRGLLNAAHYYMLDNFEPLDYDEPRHLPNGRVVRDEIWSLDDLEKMYERPGIGAYQYHHLQGDARLKAEIDHFNNPMRQSKSPLVYNPQHHTFDEEETTP